MLSEAPVGSSWSQVIGFLRVDLLDALRFWQISMFSVALTSFYYAMLTGFVPDADRVDFTTYFVILAVLGVTLFNFGTRAASERINPWNAFLRTLPAPLWTRFVARLLFTLLVGALSAGFLVSVGLVRFELSFDATAVLTMVVAIPIAILVFAPLATCLGGTLHPRVVPAAITVIYLGTAWSGGLWSGGRPPDAVTGIDFLLPLFAVRRLAEAVVGGHAWNLVFNAAVVTLWALLGLALARYVYLRDEGEKFA